MAFNYGEFAIIKIWIVHTFPNTKIFNSISITQPIGNEKLAQIARVLEVRPEDILAFDSQKYFNSVSNVKGNYAGIYISNINIEFVKKMYEDKITLLEKLVATTEKDLQKTEQQLQQYQSKYGEL